MTKFDCDSILSITDQIEQIVTNLNVSYIDACIEYCDRNQFEPEVVGEIIRNNQNIKLKIQTEAEGLNFIRKTDRLPL